MSDISTTPPDEDKPEKKEFVPVQPKLPRRNDNKPSYFWLYLIMAVLTGLMVFNNVFDFKDNLEISRTQFDLLYKTGDVSYIETINNQKALVYIKNASLSKPEYKKLISDKVSTGKNDLALFHFKIISNESLENHLAVYSKANNLPEINLTPNNDSGMMSGIISQVIYLIIFFGLFAIISRKLGGGGGGGFPGGGIFSIGRSKAVMTEGDEEDKNAITFKDVAGLDEEKVEVMEIVDFLKNPEKYTALGGKIPKGALLIGPPGTGKTLLAKAMAGEAKVPFFSISGSDFVEMFVGVGASRVRDLFKQAREKAPCIIFIDEIDAVGRARGKGMMGGNDERENTLNQLLVEMDGFGGDTGIIIVAATNRPDVLDDALLRPGRFDRQIHIDRPDLNGREQIFNVHLTRIKTGDDVSAKELSKLTPGFVGADIANVCNEAALIAARKDKTEVNMKDIHEAIDRVTTGLEKKNMIISPEEKKAIAYHEAGHALSSWFLEYAHPFVRVTIVPRSESLGHALYLPKEKYLTLKEELLDRIAVSLGGRAAEKIVFNKISTGALSDLDNVTSIAYSLVTVYGMSDKVGNVSFYRMAQQSYDKPYSPETAMLIDEEVRSIIDEQYTRVQAILNEKRDLLDRLAEMLLEREVLLKSDLEILLGKRPWDKEEDEAKETTKVKTELKSEEPKIEEIKEDVKDDQA